MLRRIAAAAAAAAAALSLLFAGVGRGPHGPQAVADSGCGTGAAGPAPAAARAATGLAALDGTTPVLVARDQATRRLTIPAVRGVARQVARDVARGVAVVDDLQGPDRVTVSGPSGARSLAGGGEVSGLTWTPRGELAWAVDARSLRQSAADGIRAVAAPPGAVGVHSPTFTGPTRLVAVVEEAPAGAQRRPGETTLNNLYAHDLATAAWSRLTSFSVTGTRWSSIRTPLVVPGGDVLFVRVSGDAGQTVPPAFSLWRLHGGQARLERVLPDETYLAGVLGSDLVLNQPDPRHGGWTMLRDTPTGLEFVGCGGTLVASLAADPDAEQAAGMAPPPGAIPAQPELAVGIGDFPSAAAAAAARTGLTDPAAWTVAGHADAPAAVRPGAWILLRRLGDGADATTELQRTRAGEPSYADRTFVVAAG